VSKQKDRLVLVIRHFLLVSVSTPVLLLAAVVLKSSVCVTICRRASSVCVTICRRRGVGEEGGAAALGPCDRGLNALVSVPHVYFVRQTHSKAQVAVFGVYVHSKGKFSAVV